MKKPFPIVGLILALFFGARTANRSDQTAHRSPARNQVENSHAAKAVLRVAPLPTGASAQNLDDCRDITATAEFEKLHWWLSRSAQGCTLTVSPAWREICKINPTHPSDEDLLAPSLTGEQFMARCLGDSGTIGSMMASVPNPQRTHLGLMTDRAIEAIQVAAAEAHFLPLSHYLPWPSPGTGAGGPSASSESEDEPKLDEPGVLIFRDVDPPSTLRPRYLLVFLIPEMPAEGLDRRVFSKAGSMIEKVSPNMDAMRFAGPDFSGSVASLRELEKGLRVAKCIHAVSGSVTNAEAYKETKESCSTFEVTQTGDHEALCEFVKGAKGFGYESNQIAILSEEGTQYGRQGPVDEAGDPKACKPDETAKLWFLHFPREISKLRNAYGAETGKAAPSDSASTAGLGLQWQDAEGSQRAMI